MKKKILAIDWGEKYIGIAISSENQKFAFPYKELKNNSEVIDEIAEICKIEGVSKIILGLPLYPKNKIKPKIYFEVLKFRDKLESRDLEVEVLDERYTSKLACKISKDKKGIHKISAYILLQNYLSI